MRPGLLGTGLLFSGSFLGTLLIVNAGGNPSRVAARSAPQSLAPGTAVATRAETPDAYTYGPPEPAIAEALVPEVADDSADDIPDVAAAQVAATTALQPEDRILAIQVLGEDSSGESLDTLLGAITSGADPRERATAIASLREHPRSYGDEARIRNAMQAASYDSDPLVVILAQAAEEELAQEP